MEASMTTTDEWPLHKQVLNTLEDDLADLRGIAAVLNLLAEPRSDFQAALKFLADEVEDHVEGAYKAYVQLVGCDEFAEQNGGPGPLMVAREGGAE
jgi:hypothetical protein